MMRKYILLITASLFLLTACQEVLSKRRLVDLLTDLYLYSDVLFSENIHGADTVNFYLSVFVRHGCTEEECRKAVAYYAQTPNIMKSIYEEVEIRMQERIAQYEQDLYLEDSLRNLWKAPCDTLFRDTVQTPFSYPFSIEIDSLCTYTFMVSARYFDDDSTLRPRLRGYVLNRIRPEDTLPNTAAYKKKRHRKKSVITEADTVQQLQEVLFERGEAKDYTMTFTVTDTLSTHIKGFWLLTDNDSTAKFQHIYLSKFRIYKPKDFPTPPFLHLVPKPLP